MSNEVFPALAGLAWDIIKTPIFASNKAQHISGREVRVSNYQNPLWRWELSYNFLRGGVEAEIQTLMAFHMKRRGSFDTFLYVDASESNVVVNGALGTGDGVTDTFQVTKSYGGFTEPVGYVLPSSLRVYVDTVEVFGFIVDSLNRVIFTTAPDADAVITASYTWYYRVRFEEDLQEYTNFMFSLWDLKKLAIVSVKP